MKPNRPPSQAGPSCPWLRLPERRAAQVRGAVYRQTWPEAVDGHWARTAGLCCGLAVVALLTVLVFVGDRPASPADLGIDPEKPVPADSLLPAFRLDAAACDAALRGKRIKVAGRVKGVRPHGPHAADLLLVSDNGAVVLHFDDSDVVSRLREADRVVAEGVCSGLAAADEVILRDAAIRRVHRWQDRELGRSALAAEAERTRRERLRTKTRVEGLLRNDARFFDRQPYAVILGDAGGAAAYDFTLRYGRPQEDDEHVERHARALVGYCLEALRDEGREPSRGGIAVTAVASHDRRGDRSGDGMRVYGAAVYDPELDDVTYIR